MFIRVILVLSLVIHFAPLFGQSDWDNDGEIEDVEIEIIKDREITLPKASRNFDKIPPMDFTSTAPDIKYAFPDLHLPLPALNYHIRPLKIKAQPLQKLYGNYIKAGFGNFTTPYLETYFTNKRNKQYMYGMQAQFINSKTGPIDDENSGSGRLHAELFGKYFGKKVTLSGAGGFTRRDFRYYGYGNNVEINTDSPDHDFNDIYVKTSIENTNDDAKVNYAIGMQFNAFSDNYAAVENEFQFDVKSHYDLNQSLTLNVQADLDVIAQSTENIDVDTRNIIRIRPSLAFDYNGFKIDAGLTVVHENDTLGEANDLHVYPWAKVKYALSSGVQIHAGIRGDVEKQSYRQLAYQNPFLGSNIQVFNTYNTFELFGGVHTTLTSKLGFGAGVSVANYQNMSFYVNRPDDQSKFQVVYDQGNTAILNINGQLSYNREDIFRLTLRGDYWGYDTDKVDEAYHRPNYKVSVLSTFRLFDKIRFEANGYLMGGIKALDSTTLQDVDLDKVLDLNLTVEYLVSDQFSAFVRFNNILAKEYEVLYQYPVRGFQVMAGITYSF